MYKCAECGKTFEEPWETYDKATGSHESGCIHCGCEDYEMVYQCVKCGEMAAEEKGGLCEECTLEVWGVMDDIKTVLIGYGMSAYDAVSVMGGYVEAN